CQIIQMLLKYGADINKTNHLKQNALMVAAGNGAIEALECLLGYPNIVIDQQDQHGKSALIHAALENKCRSIQILVNHGADINKTTLWGSTALILAAVKGNINAVQCLLDNLDINIDQQDDYGTALTAALLFAEKNKVIIIKL